MGIWRRSGEGREKRTATVRVLRWPRDNRSDGGGDFEIFGIVGGGTRGRRDTVQRYKWISPDVQ